MKVAVTAVAPDISAQQEPRFGRAPYFVIVDTESMKWEGVENPGASATGGAAIQAVQFLSGKGVDAVVCAGNYGPNAFNSLKAAGIKMYANPRGGPIGSVIEAFKAGRLSEVTAPGREGMGGGHGHGHGHGGGWR